MSRTKAIVLCLGSAVAALAIVVGVAWGVAPCGKISIANPVYPLAIDNVQNPAADRIFHIQTMRLNHEVTGNHFVEVLQTSATTGNVTNAWVRLDGDIDPSAPWAPMWNQGKLIFSLPTTGDHQWEIRTRWDQNAHGYVTVQIYPWVEKPRSFGWQTCKPTVLP